MEYYINLLLLFFAFAIIGWCIEGRHLITVPEVSKTAKFFEQKLKESIYGMTDDQINETLLGVRWLKKT